MGNNMVPIRYIKQWNIIWPPEIAKGTFHGINPRLIIFRFSPPLSVHIKLVFWDKWKPFSFLINSLTYFKRFQLHCLSKLRFVMRMFNLSLIVFGYKRYLIFTKKRWIYKTKNIKISDVGNDLEWTPSQIRYLNVSTGKQKVTLRRHWKGAFGNLTMKEVGVLTSA